MTTRGFNEKSDGFTIVEVMIVIAIIALLSAIAIPNYINMRNKGYCTEAETDADHIGAAIADYFGTGIRTGLPDIGDLQVSILNSAEISGNPNTLIIIKVTDRTRRCPLEYQKGSAHWDLNYVFTKQVQ